MMKTPQEDDREGNDALKIFTQKILILSVFMVWAYMLYLLGSVLTVVFFAGFLTILLSPFLESMNRKRIPDWIGLLFIFLGVLFFFFVALFAIIPIFVKQSVLLFWHIGSSFGALDALYKSGGVDALGFPDFLRSYIGNIDFGTLFEFVRNNISSISGFATTLSANLFQSSTSLVSSVSGGIFQTVMIMVFTFFMSLERHSIKAFLYRVVPTRVSEYLTLREDAFLQVLRAWIRGQIILWLTIFLFTLVWLLCLGLFGIKIEGILTLALIAWLMEFIPYVGPFLALLPALAIVAGMGMTPVVSVLILYIIIQQAENNIIVPMVMSKTLSLPPFLIILVMTVMASLFGIAGILLAIPFAAILQILVQDLLVWRNGEEWWGRLTRKAKRI